MHRVILIDDNPIFLEALSDALAVRDDVVVAGTCRSGALGIVLARRERPDLVIVDLRMPDIDGIETCRRLRAEFPALRIVLVSLLPDDTNDELRRRSGADAFFSKSALYDALPTLLPGAGGAGRAS